MKDLVAPIVIASLFFAALVGWILNIVKLIAADALTGMVVARAVGIFVAPLGAVLGWVG